MLRVREVALSASASVEATVAGIKNHRDHYSNGAIPSYDPIRSELLRVYAYTTTPEGIDPRSLTDITASCAVTTSASDSVTVRLPPAPGGRTHAGVLVAFTLFYPDVFAPHLMEFQRGIIRQYAGLPLAGACKDEWGFPAYFPRFTEEHTVDFWYSPHRAKAHAAQTGGRDLLADCLLMARLFQGREIERQVAVNQFNEATLQRNTALENDFYAAVKEAFGPLAAVTVHCTWWPYPDRQEMRKNGLDWWAARRDWAQTDEIVPFGVRTALTKKTGSAIWYNMYYTNLFPIQLWSSALAGGRLNYLHFQRLYDPALMRAESRVRLLNPISRSPVDCPVAVIFGHPGAMNWAGPHFEEVGMPLLNLLWNAGYPADLIPTSEIENGSLQVDADGWIRYGQQRYAAVVLHQPEWDKPSTSAFFQRAAQGNKSALFREGNWTRDFLGQPVEAQTALPASMAVKAGHHDAFQGVIEVLQRRGIAPQTPATEDLDSRYFTLRGFNQVSKFPPTTGFSRLIDGTVIHVAGAKEVSGDPIQTTFPVGRYTVSFDAIGVAAVRLDDDGHLQALAAGSLKSFRTGDFELTLDERADLALWKDDQGNWRGLLQGWSGEIPPALRRITDHWERVALPVPPPEPATTR
jgi:hypothetical protein